MFHETSSMTRDAHIDELSAALVPVLLHRLNNTTQYLSTLNSLLALGPDDSSARYFEGLAGTSNDVDELGWLLGVAANACGANLLLERRERAGVAAMVRVTAEILRREGRDLERVDRVLPTFSTLERHAPRDVSWSVAWLIGSWLLACGRECARGTPLAWDLSADGDELAIVCAVPCSASLLARVDRWRAAPLQLGLVCGTNGDRDEARLVVSLDRMRVEESRS